MNVLIVQENGRHPENVNYRECNCLARALDACGHKAVCWGPGHSAYGASIGEHYRAADAVIVMEQYDETGWVPPLPGDKPTVYWAIDAHCARDHERELAKRVNANIILCGVLPEVQSFSDIAPSLWWPNAYPGDLIDGQGLGCPKMHGIGFCGTMGPPARQDAIQRLTNAVGMKLDVMVLGDAMVGAIAGYRIGWNMNIGTDVNYRTFEVCGAGTMLLTNETPGLKHLIEPGTECVVYNGIDDCIDKARYYLSHDHERVASAERGHAAVSLRHTYEDRAYKLIGVVKSKGEYNPYVAND